MARLVLIALVVANIAYFVWARGDAEGDTRLDREPQRLTQQVRPQLLQIRKPGGPGAASPSAGATDAAPVAEGDAVR